MTVIGALLWHVISNQKGELEISGAGLYDGTCTRLAEFVTYERALEFVNTYKETGGKT